MIIAQLVMTELYNNLVVKGWRHLSSLYYVGTKGLLDSQSLLGRRCTWSPLECASSAEDLQGRKVFPWGRHTSRLPSGSLKCSSACYGRPPMWSHSQGCSQDWHDSSACEKKKFNYIYEYHFHVLISTSSKTLLLIVKASLTLNQLRLQG